MRLVLSVLAGLAGAVAGWVVAAAIVLIYGEFTGIVDQDGGYAMMAIFAFGPVGAILGLVLAIWLIRRLRGDKGAGRLIPQVVIAIAAILLAAAGAAYWFAGSAGVTNRLPPQLVFEIMLPPGAHVPARVSHAEALARRSPIELSTSENIMSAEIDGVRWERGQFIVSGRAEMRYRVRDRLLVLKQPDGDVIFDVRLAAAPASGSQSFAFPGP